MERFYNVACDPKRMGALSLAFIGDAVFEVFVRERLVCQAERPVSKLHRAAVEQVCAHAQAAFVQKLLPVLTQEEQDVLRRGRNAHSNHVPKNSDPAEYHAATAFESLFGYLYLSGRLDRLRELFETVCGED
ncbi:Mini-ribonuclease 3 [Caproicibacter sp.]|uniref:Mini-ribonuclease 3 n=1 Tax=Caproicibacter sp. TaxID=2814884 RepID=UPI003989568F